MDRGTGGEDSDSCPFRPGPALEAPAAYSWYLELWFHTCDSDACWRALGWEIERLLGERATYS